MTQQGDDDRRGDPPGRRLTDNQLLAWRKEGETAHGEIERDIALNHASIAGLVDELTAFRTETNTQFSESRHDRDALKDALETAQAENRRQFTGIAECISDLKAWQAAQDRDRDQLKAHKAEREQYEDRIYQEMLANFTFTRKLRKVLWGLVLSVAAIFGLAHTTLNLWDEIKHLLQGAP